MNYYWKMAKFILVFVLALSLIGCGTSDTTKVETQKVEQTKENSKKELKKETKKEADKAETQPIATNAEANPKVQSDENTVTVTEKPETKPKETTTTTTKTKPTNSTTTAPPAAAPSTPAPSPPVPSKSVTVSIAGPNGSILGATKVNFKEGATVLDVLIQLVGRENVDSSGSGVTAYVHGIKGIYEFDNGPTSGWTYQHNGVIVSKSAGAVKVKDGDSISWIYKKS